MSKIKVPVVPNEVPDDYGNEDLCVTREQWDALIRVVRAYKKLNQAIDDATWEEHGIDDATGAEHGIELMRDAEAALDAIELEEE